MNAPREITSCEVCGNTDLPSVLDLGRHPLCDDLVPVGDTRVCREYPIEILFCARCVTAHQRFQVPKQDLFPKTYHYRSRFTADVLSGMQALVESCEARLGSLAGKVVLDIGCNDGSLLDRFRAKGCTTVGVEPTGAYADALGRDHAIYNAFFNEALAGEILQAHGRPDIITFTNVFAHIEDLPQLLRALALLMSPGTTLVIENHYLGAVLDRQQFDTFYHEHPRTYSLSSFLHIARSLGADVTAVEFPSRYGGNIRVFMGRQQVTGVDATDVSAVLAREADFGDRLHHLQSEVEAWSASMRERLAGLVAKHGRLSAKAFPGRAAILIKLLGIGDETLAEVFEKPGSMKIGHYLPGTRIPIKSDDELFARSEQPPVIVNLAWHISSEIRAYLTQHGYRGEIVDVLDPASLATGR